jgi:hypothetical protein
MDFPNCDAYHLSCTFVDGQIKASSRITLERGATDTPISNVQTYNLICSKEN